jgi:deoxyxylulose-5-phosphate synthase
MSRRCVRVLTNLPRDSSKPTAVICHTVKGKGIAFAENNMAWHHQNKVTAQDAERLLAARGALMRKRCLDEVYELARRDERIVFIGSDLGVGTLDRFKNEFPIDSSWKASAKRTLQRNGRGPRPRARSST